MKSGTDNLYENSYTNAKHFSFGKNWQVFLKTLNEQKIEEAMKSLTNFMGGKQHIEGKTFIDMGCGSGLFSLAAYRLGARKIVSVDIDEFSLVCTSHLRKLAGDPQHWEVKKGSALDVDFISSLGSFDLVYSWGVLHHTGDMYAALRNVTTLVDPHGKLFIAIYNNNKVLLEGSSRFWLNLKSFYNNSHVSVKKIIEVFYVSYYIAGLIVHGKNLITYIQNYQTLRGMNFMIDIKDWLGGFPYEYARPDQIVDFYEKLGFKCMKQNPARSIGCNEFLLTHKI